MQIPLFATAVVLGASLVVALPAQAQTEPFQPTLELDPAYLTGEAEDGIIPGHEGMLEAPWTLDFTDPATAAAELSGDGGSIAWALDCPQTVTMSAGPTQVEYVAGQSTYEGKADLKVVPGPDARGVEPIPCMLTGTFT